MRKRYDHTFFTEEQVKVLRLRAEGYTLEQIASILGTSKSNIHSILKKAKETLERAKRTIDLYREIYSTISFIFNRGDSLANIITHIYNTADIYGIKIRMRSLELLYYLREILWNCLEPRKDLLLCDIHVKIDRDGHVIVSTKQ